MRSILKKIAIGFAAIFLLLLILLATQITFDIPVEELKVKYTNDQSKFMTIQGMDVHYRDEGQGKNLVLIHGTSSSLHTWDGWTKQLKDSFRIIRLDMPAFGLTGPNKNNTYSIKSYVEFLHEFLQKMNIQQCYLAGNSLGGQIAWGYALAYPNEIEKLILVDAAGYPYPKDHKITLGFRVAQMPIAKNLMKYVTPKFIFKQSLGDAYGDPKKITPELLNRYYDLTLRAGNRGALVARMNSKFMPQYDDTPKLKMPTLILWGEKDKLIPVDHAYKFERDIQNTKLIVYEEIGHVPMEEIPVKTAQDVQEFLIQ